MLEVAVFLKMFGGAVEAMRTFGDAVGTARKHAAEVHEAKDLLGLTDPSAEAYRSDSVHPLFASGELHPDNKAALLAAGSDLMTREVIRRDSLAADATDSSLLLFGSPVSDGLSRIIFGYSELPDREGLTLGTPQFDLAYAWDLDPDQLGNGLVRRLVPGKGLVKRPPWQIRDLRGGADPQLVPRTDSEGLLQEDYLLVTRTPNFLSWDAESSGKFLVSFGGAHGTGTRAIDLLFNDRQLMARVLRELKVKSNKSTHRLGGVPSAYQLLFRVSRIKHGATGSIPRSLELVDVVVLRNEPEDWKSARRSIAPRLEAWRKTGTPSPEHDDPVKNPAANASFDATFRRRD
jgi:hypothetical protein